MKEVLHYSSYEGSADSQETVKVMDTEQTLLFALEGAGVIKPADEIAQPIDRIISEAELEDSEFMRRRDIRSLEDLQVDEDQRNAIHQQLTRLINERLSYDEDQIRSIKNYGQWYFRKKGLPVVQHILKGLILRDRNSELPPISKQAEDLAPEIMWMMIKEDEEAKKNSEAAVA